jgi:hypothetical protein
VKVTLVTATSFAGASAPVATSQVDSSTFGEMDFNMALKFLTYFLVSFSVSFLKKTTVGSSRIDISIFQSFTALVKRFKPLTRLSLTLATSLA